MNTLATLKKNLFLYCLGLFFLILATLPNFAQAAPNKVSIGIYITRLFDANLRTNDYSSTFWLWALYQPFDDWNPENNLDFLNAKEVIKLTSTSDQAKNGQIWWQGKYRATAIADWDVQHYPFDVQDIYFLIEDNSLEAEKLQFVPDIKNSGIAKDAVSQDWQLKKFEISSTPIYTPTNFGDPSSANGSDFSRFTVHIELKRANSWSKFIAVFSANFIAILLAFTVLLLPIDNWNARMSLSAAATIAAVGGHYSLQNLLPYSRHFTLSDEIELLVFVFLFLVLGSSIICGKLYASHGERTAVLVNRTLITLAIILVPLCIYLFIRNIV